jgi:YVTN family beta-propeller protein
MNKTKLSCWLLVSLAMIMAPTRAGASSGTLIVLNKTDNTAMLIDLADGKVRATIPTGAGPHEVAVSSDGRLAVVTNYGTRQEPGSTLTVIDVAKAAKVKDIDLGEYRRPRGAGRIEMRRFSDSREIHAGWQARFGFQRALR